MRRHSVYGSVVAVIGVIATLVASIRPDVEGAGRLHELAATASVKTPV